MPTNNSYSRITPEIENLAKICGSNKIDVDLYTKYDVSTAPKLYLLDSAGIVIAKDITPETLRQILSL